MPTTMIDLNMDISELSVTPAMSLDTLKYVEPGKIPNQRTLIIPDPGMTIIDMDLTSADPHFVAWEANDANMKKVLLAGKSIYLEGAKTIWATPITKDDPRYKVTKIGGNGINYGAYPKKLARELGIDIKLANWFYMQWFKIYPGVKEWHSRIRTDLATKRLVRNAFGFERYYFERPEDCLNAALAWCPQSSVGIIINKAWANIDANIPEVEVLMQDHDNLVMQTPTAGVLNILPKLQEQALVVVPYPEPLIVPVGFKISDISWGDVKDPTKDNPTLTAALANGLINARKTASCQLA